MPTKQKKVCLSLFIHLFALTANCNPLCNMRVSYEGFSDNCEELSVVKQLLQIQNSTEADFSSACVGGGFGNQINGIKAGIVLSLATHKPLVKIKNGYDYNSYFKLLHSTSEAHFNSTQCPIRARQLSANKFIRVVGEKESLPKKIAFSGRPQYLGFLASANLKLSEYELKCLVRTTMNMSDLFTAKMTEFIDSTPLKRLCTGELSSLVSIHIRIGDSELISKSAVKKYGLKKYYATHTVFSVENIEKVFNYAVSLHSDSTKTLFFLATDSLKVKKRFRDFFADMNHMTQSEKIRHTHRQNHASLLMSAIDIAVLSYGDSLVHTGSSFAEAAHLLQLNPGQKKFQYQS